MSTEISDNDLSTKAQDNKQSEVDRQILTLIQEVLADIPALDQQKVQAVLAKLKKGEMEILGNAKEQEECIKRIAQKIITEDSAQ